MSHVGSGYDINQTFVIEGITNEIPTISACTSVYSNALISCSGNTNIILGSGVISFDGNLYTNDDISGNTIYASTYFSGGTNLFNIINANNITGGTFNDATDTLTLYKTNNSFISVSGISNFYTTGATLIGETVYFNRNDELSAYTVNLSSLSGANTYVTGMTFNDNQLIIVRNDNVSINTFINSFTGLTISGVLNANIVSATTYYGDGSNLTGVAKQDTFVTGGTYSAGTAVFTNNTGGTFNVSGFSTGGTSTSSSFTGGTVSGATNFTGGLSATTLSATTYLGLPLDIHVTGFTFNNGNYNITINQNDGSSYTQSLSTLASDITITGGTYSPVTGIATFTNNTGGTFTVTGFLTGYTDTTISAFTYNNANTFKIDTTNGVSFSATINSVTGLTATTLSASTYLGLPTDIRVTGGTYLDGTAVFTNNTGGTFNVSGFSTSFDFTGGTVSGATNFTGGLSANTFSASTYLGLPTDVFVTGGTYSSGTANFTNNTGGTFTVTGFSTSNATAFTGGTVSGATNFTNGLTANTVSATTYFNLPTFTGAYLPLSGGTVSGATSFTGGLTANTLSANTYLGLPIDIRVTGGTYTNGNAIFTNNTGGTFSVSGFAIGGGGGQLFYLNISQSKNGNRYLSTTASTLAEQSTGVTINNGVTETIASFQSDQLGVTLIPGGVWSFYLHSYKENSNATFDIFVEVYKLSNGGTSTLLFTTDPVSVTSNSPNPSMQLTDGYFSGSSVVITDSLVAVVRATNTNNQSHTITLVSEGSQHYSYAVSTLQTQQGLTCDTLSGCSIIQTIQSDINNKLDKSGGTITGNLVINGGLTATTISASTYQNLPTDIRVTGGTYSNGISTFINNTGGTFSISGYFTGATDVFVTGGTYSNGSATFRNNTGGTFNVSGFLTGATDVFVTGGTYSSGTAVFTNNTGGTFSVTGFSTGGSSFTGGTVNGATNFTGGLTANTFSATTYLNLPSSIITTASTTNLTGFIKGDGTNITVDNSTYITPTSTNTLTNKTINKRILSITSNPVAPSIDTSLYDQVDITNQTSNITGMTTNLVGTPSTDQLLMITFRSASGSPTIAWGLSFEASGTIGLPTSFTTTTIRCGFQWNNVSKWTIIAYA